MTLVLTLLLHGCPIPARGAAYALAERTVRHGLPTAGQHAARLHDQRSRPSGATQAQADETRARVRGGVVWAALSLAVASRFWLATVVARRRDGLLVHLLLRRTLQALRGGAFLRAGDGFARDVTAAQTLGRVPLHPGQRGRPRLVRPEGFALVQVVTAGLQRGEEIVRRAVVGTAAPVAAALATSHGGPTINTAYSERLKAMVRERLAPLVRRRRTPAQGIALVESSLHLLPLAYNWCWTHESLRRPAVGPGQRWLERTPARAAGLAARPYTLDEILHQPLHPVPCPAPAPPPTRTAFCTRAPPCLSPPLCSSTGAAHRMTTVPCGCTRTLTPARYASKASWPCSQLTASSA